MVVSYWECGVMGARVPWEHEARFKSDISSRGILSIGKTSQSICPVLARMTDTLTSVLLEHKVREADCQAHNLEAGGSNPSPATPSKRKEKKEMRSTVLTREMNQIKKIQFWFCIQKNWIIYDVLVRLRGLCEL